MSCVMKGLKLFLMHAETLLQKLLLPAGDPSTSCRALHTFDTQHRQKADLEHSCLLQDTEGDTFYPPKSIGVAL